MFVLLETKRLMLRPPKAADIGRFLPLIADFEVSKNLATVPHPYTEDDACAYITTAAEQWASGKGLPFAILRKEDGAFIGVCGVHPTRKWALGYWIGKPYWGKGYATEAMGRLIAFAFDERGAERLTALWYVDNPASGRVLEKLGFAVTGREETECLARGTRVLSHAVALDGATYRTRRINP